MAWCGLVPVVVGSPFAPPFSLAPLIFGEDEPSLKRAAAPGQSGPREAIEDSAPDADHEASGQSAHQTAGRHAEAAPVVRYAISDQILAAQICALRVAASQRLDERLLLESLASPGEWHLHGAAPDHFLTHLAIWEGPGEGQGPRPNGRPGHRRRIPRPARSGPV